MVRCGSCEQNNVSGGRGSGFGGTVRHVVTYRDPLGGTLVHTVFYQKVSKTVQKGGTPYFDHFLGRFHLPWYPPPSPELSDSEMSPFSHPTGHFPHFEPKFRGVWGGQRVKSSQDRVF